jgi:hypothetical protein
MPKYSLFSFTTFLDLEEVVSESFNILKNNISGVELAKVLRYFGGKMNWFRSPRKRKKPQRRERS